MAIICNNLLRQAIFNNSFSMLQLLLRYICIDTKMCHLDNSNKPLYTAHTWAIVLRLETFAEVLQSAGVPDNRDSIHRCPPFVKLIEETDALNRNLKLIPTLSSLGYDVNSVSEDGSSPLYAFSVHLRRDTPLYLEAYRMLVLAGAQPLKENYFVFVDDPKMLKILLDTNSDIADKGNHGHSLVCLLVACKKKSSSISFYKYIATLVLCVNTISTFEHKLLSRICIHDDKLSEESKEVIQNTLFVPRPLKYICRNVLRRTIGMRIHDFVDEICIPRTLKDFLLLKEELRGIS